MVEGDNTPKDDFFCSKRVTPRYTRIKTIMLDRGIKSIQDLADKCGVSRSMMSLVMHNHKEPYLPLKLKIAEVLNTDSRVVFPEDDGVEKV